MVEAGKDLTIKLDKEITSIVKRFRINKNLISSREKLTYLNFFSDRMLMVLVIREGVPYSFFSLIQHYAPFIENDWADLLDISTKSLQRYKQTSRQFKPSQSEKIIEMAEVTNIGIDVFSDIAKFKLWLDTPNYSLGNLKPMELLRDSCGKEMVIGELTRINHGILA